MICSRCQKERPDNGEYKTCERCKKSQHKYEADHREKGRERALKSYYERRKCDPEKIRAQKREWKRKNPVAYMLTSIRQRAKKKGLDFDLVHEDIIIPDTCPVLGIKLHVSDGKSSPNSPSIDRFDSTGGYTKDNVRIISHRANTIKSDATIEEIEKILKYMRSDNKELL